MNQIINIRLQGVSSLQMAILISRKLSALPGVKSVRTSEEQTCIEHNGIDEQILIDAVRSAGGLVTRPAASIKPIRWTPRLTENALMLPPSVRRTAFPPMLNWFN